MNLILTILFFLIFLFSVSNTALYYTYFWQLKEYRPDRMRDFLSTPTGKKRLFWPIGLIKIVFLLFSALLLGALVLQPVAFSKETFLNFIYLANLFVLLIWFWELIDFAGRVKQRKIYRPDATAKALIILFLAILLPFLAGWHFSNNFFNDLPYLLLYLGIVDSLAVPLTHLIVLIFIPITNFSKRLILAKAHRKIARMQGLKVIGITGSYGKSSTKEFLAQILEKKFRVLKTPGNVNTEIGVAQVILKYLKPEHEVLIVEAGAYKKGEIKKIVEMVAPRIGIITAVKDSHLSLFGSLENIKLAKFELIEGLPEFGTAIFNADNEGAVDLAKRACQRKLAKILTYGIAPGSDWRAEEITEDKDGIKFKVKNILFSAPVPGKHNVSNLLAAMMAANEMGIPLEEMVTEVAKVKLREHTLTVIQVNENLRLVDDTYNANPDGVRAALDYLKLHQDWQKIVIFPGMLELGGKSDEEHRKVAMKMAEICDFVFVTSHDFEVPLRAGWAERKFDNFEFTTDDQNELLSKLKARIQTKKTVVLFVSRGSELVLRKLKNAT